MNSSRGASINGGKVKKCITYNTFIYVRYLVLCRGGSGLAVFGPPPSNGSPPGAFDNIVQRASNPSEPREGAPVGPGRVVTMYRNGFTVDDGPLRDLVSPESRAFLQSLERGEAPRGTIVV